MGSLPNLVVSVRILRTRQLDELCPQCWLPALFSSLIEFTAPKCGQFMEEWTFCADCGGPRIR